MILHKAKDCPNEEKMQKCVDELAKIQFTYNLEMLKIQALVIEAEVVQTSENVNLTNEQAVKVLCRHL